MARGYAYGATVLLEVERLGLNFTALVGAEGRSLPALLTRADVAVPGLPSIVPELFVGLVRAVEGGLAKARELRRRVLTFTALYTSSDPGPGATKTLGLSPTMYDPTPTNNPPDLEEAIGATRLLPAQGEV